MIVPDTEVSPIVGLYSAASSSGKVVVTAIFLIMKYCGSDASKAAVVFSVAIPTSLMVYVEVVPKLITRKFHPCCNLTVIVVLFGAV